MKQLFITSKIWHFNDFMCELYNHMFSIYCLKLFINSFRFKHFLLLRVLLEVNYTMCEQLEKLVQLLFFSPFSFLIAFAVNHQQLAK